MFVIKWFHFKSIEIFGLNFCRCWEVWQIENKMSCHTRSKEQMSHVDRQTLSAMCINGAVGAISSKPHIRKLLIIIMCHHHHDLMLCMRAINRKCTNLLHTLSLIIITINIFDNQEINKWANRDMKFVYVFDWSKRR